MNDKEQKLISIVKEVQSLYPELSNELATIEWRKIWMPQIKKLGSVVDGQKGIYRLILKEDNGQGAVAHFDVYDAEGKVQTMPVCYVGQAINIKER